MADFNFVTARLATGAAIKDESDVAALVVSGVTDVIDCRAEFDDAALLTSQGAISYLWNGTKDDGGYKSDIWFQKGIEFALSAFQHVNRKVYCHCAAGVNRGPSMAYAILRSVSFNAVLAENVIRLARPQVGLRYKEDADAAIASLGYE